MHVAVQLSRDRRIYDIQIAEVLIVHISYYREVFVQLHYEILHAEFQNIPISDYWSLITSSLFIVNSTDETYLTRVSLTDWHMFHYKRLCYYASSLKKLVL